MKSILFCALFFPFAGLCGADFHDFDSSQYALTKDQVEKKIITYLEKEKEIKAFYCLTKETLTIGDLKNAHIDYILHLRDFSSPSLKSVSPRSSLNGIKIALDPGHFGGAYAELEERFIRIPKEGAPIQFNEGDLTYLTAITLKALLEKEGATVFITRPGIGQGAIKESFEEWEQKHPELRKEENPSKLFRAYYNNEDLNLRASLINAFQPDLTVIIHYNAQDAGEADTLTTPSNYNLAFIPGAFCAKELEKRENRYEFLRMIVTNDVEESLILSQSIVQQFVQKLRVPVISNDAKTSFLHFFCLFQQPGVYSRNLALTRLIHGPLCYGETLLQNNEEEIYRLSANDREVSGYPCPKRVEEVAQAYYEGILGYFKNR